MIGDAAQLAAGLVEGHLEETSELVRLLRLARLEIEQPDGIDWQRDALSGLRWQDLDHEEYDLCPPMVLIGSDEMLAGRGLGQLMWLLNSGLPIKALVLSALEFGLVETRTNDPRAGLSLLALAQRNAYVAQCSVARPAHFAESLLQALRHDGPALIQVYAPSPARHGFASDRALEQAQLAVASRALPLFRYDPEGEGVFGSRISLDGNPQSGASLAEEDGKPLTLADWALGQSRFASNFSPLAGDAPGPLPLHEWLQLDPRGRRAKTPYVIAGGDDDERRYSMTSALADAAGGCLQSWQTLQELAGIVTPFTKRLEEEIRADVAAEHQAELDALKQASAAEALEIRKNMQAEIAVKLRSRLLELASRKRD
jgi:pyruvate-ferredoxin/flavodoxin oxidoreductase